ncbi:type II toxin-antitoxin system HicB family antitoxin [Ralstonia chuxiongensis]|uniref:Type II toxin-antitoxin system HicB family antitoxin n=1 Tax=Ralstonia chuxiongensis TaxID=2957504 RepID=A0AA41WWZ9_9RALS|nr:type II toxin-antitoxin system HicB family antitoxin [Ralstonia chuxiongensis]MCP1174368.1 type II toxin-antitoxin system HicB family antitoxin [Ralstonia chuxiongensis]
MNNMLEYRNYYGSVAYSSEDRCLMGKLEFIDDLILFDGTTVEEIELAFHDAVDSYLEFCAERGKEPSATFKGTFNVRVGSELHRKAAVAARKNGQTLNDFVKCAIEHMLYEDPRAHEKPVHHYHLVTRQTFREETQVEFFDPSHFPSDYDQARTEYVN